MDLTNKSKVDFTDAHLWGESVEFHCTIPIRKIADFFSLLWAIEMLVHPHMDMTDDTSCYVHVEFKCRLMHPRNTKQLLEALVARCYNTGHAAVMHSEGYAASLSSDGTIIDRRELDHA